MQLVQRFELYACLQCGKCTGGCPVSLRTDLNIRRIMRELIFVEEEVLKKEAIWDCTTCKTCTLRCPRGLEPSQVIVALRANLVERGRVPKTVIEALEATYVHGNPWGRARQKRADWAEGINVKDLTKGEKSEGLYFVCCAPSYDPRLQRVSRSIALIMKVAGVDFGILGISESCCGNEIRRLGEEGLFEELREQNKEKILSSGVKWIVTTSPHCLNALKNEYGLEDIRVYHYTEFFLELLKEGRLPFKNPLVQKVVYHDPCFLGKQNNIYDPPRDLLRGIPELKLLEFSRSREISLCCEGGGGRMWVEGTGRGTRNSEIRIKDAEALGADIIATACPFCLLTLEDALKTMGLDEKLQVKDIAELLSEALGLEVER